MELFLCAVIIGLIVILLLQKQKRTKTSTSAIGEKDSSEPEPDKKDLPIAGAYHKSWMFSYNEKDAYNKLKPIAEELGYTVFAKVRLLDLLEPTRGSQKYKTYFYKVQAKHVDFVLCDKKLVAQYIIELDDRSHDEKSRKERDSFVDEVVKSVGYKIIHTRAITEDIKGLLDPSR